MAQLRQWSRQIREKGQTEDVYWFRLCDLKRSDVILPQQLFDAYGNAQRYFGTRSRVHNSSYMYNSFNRTVGFRLDD